MAAQTLHHHVAVANMRKRPSAYCVLTERNCCRHCEETQSNKESQSRGQSAQGTRDFHPDFKKHASWKYPSWDQWKQVRHLGAQTKNLAGVHVLPLCFFRPPSSLTVEHSSFLLKTRSAAECKSDHFSFSSTCKAKQSGRCPSATKTKRTKPVCLCAVCLDRLWMFSWWNKLHWGLFFCFLFFKRLYVKTFSWCQVKYVCSVVLVAVRCVDVKCMIDLSVKSVIGWMF